MNCRSFERRRTELLDTNPDSASTADLRRHLDSCPQCAREFGELQSLMAALAPSSKTGASPNLKERIMKKIDSIEAGAKPLKPNRFRAGALRFTFAAVLLLGMLACRNCFAPRTGLSPLTPFETLAQAAESTSGLKSLHIEARMRNLAGDNFDYITPDMDFVPVEIWQAFGDSPRWRVQKPRRTVTMDGASTLLVFQQTIKSNVVAVRLHPNPVGAVGWLSPLLDVNSLFLHEQEAAKGEGAHVTVQEKKDGGGSAQIVLTIDAKAQGNFSQSKYTRDTSIAESDNIRIYTFDAITHRLQKMQVFMNVKGSKDLVFETTRIEYDVPINPSLLKADVPKGVRLLQGAEQIGASGNTAKTPEEAAQAIFKAMSDEDWNTLHAYAGTICDDPKLQRLFGGLKVKSIGKAFRSGTYPGLFVPYEITLKSGKTIHHNLALRNDNPKHLWMFDGGL